MLSHKVITPLRAAPFALQAYTVFAVTVTFADWVVFWLAPESFRSHLVPFTGWGASMFYSFTIFFAFALSYQQKRRRVTRLSITLQLMLSIAFGAFQIYQRHGQNFGNPYLTVSPWRWVWTMLIPGIWILILHSPRMSRFCHQEHQSHRLQESH